MVWEGLRGGVRKAVSDGACVHRVVWERKED